MVNITLEGLKQEVKDTVKVLRNVTIKSDCAVLEKSWNEEDGYIKAEIEFYPEASDYYVYWVDDVIYCQFNYSPEPLRKEDMGYWQKASSSDLRRVVKRDDSDSSSYVCPPDGNVYRCKDGVWVVKDSLLKKTKISENSNLPLCVD